MSFSVLIISTSPVYLETIPRPSRVGDWRRSCGNDVSITAFGERIQSHSISKRVRLPSRLW